MVNLKPDQDDEALKMSQRGDSDETAKSSSSSSYYDNIDWSLVSEWCRNFLNLSDADLDSLWYERLASAALHHEHDGKVDEARKFYRLALEKENPSWLCHRWLGTTYVIEKKFDEVMKCFELAIAEAEKDGAVPKPEPTDIFTLHLLLGECALETGDLKKAAESYLQAVSSEDVDQAMRAQLGQMKAVIRSPDPNDSTKWLQDKLSEDAEGRRLCDILTMAAREDDNGDFIPKMFTLASEKLDTLKGVVRAMETATARPNPGAESDEVNPILNDESAGVLKYYRGLATYIYKHKVVSETVDPFREALRLWEECCDQLSNIDTYNAYIIRQRARVRIAQHYFEDMLARDRLDDVDKLAQLARFETQAQGQWEASGFLSALYAHHGDTSNSRAALVRKIRLGMEVLSDETPQNDDVGFNFLWEALVQHGDFVNATIALLLYISPDVLTNALAFGSEDVRDSEGQVNQRLLDVVQKLAEKTLEVMKSQLSETSPQHQRLTVAREHIDTCLSAISSSNDTLEGGEGQSQLTLANSETVAAYRLIQERLRASQEHITEVTDWTWTCDGRTADGKPCTKTEVYHCIYCPNIDFCDDCLGRLRDPDRGSDMETTVCSSKHRWLKLPLPSSGLYAGPQAKSLRTPKVQPRHEDHQILEVSGVGDATVNVEDWKEDIARAWGIVLDGGESGAGKTDAS